MTDGGGDVEAKGYVILTEDIHDAEGMAAYGRASAASLAEFGGRPLVVDHDVEVLEGTWHGTRTVVVEFESVDRARVLVRVDELPVGAPTPPRCCGSARW